MLDEVLLILKGKLNQYLKLMTRSPDDTVVFLDGSKTEPLLLPLDRVTLLLINIEEEKIIRQASRHNGHIKNGLQTDLNPAIGINMTVLFVPRFSDYEQTLKFMSLIISYFQRFPVLTSYNTPALPDTIEQIGIELVTMPIAQQNEIWSSLRTTYLPSVVYKIGVLVYSDDTSVETAAELQIAQLKTATL